MDKILLKPFSDLIDCQGEDIIKILTSILQEFSKILKDLIRS